MTFDVRNDRLDATIRDALRWQAERAPDLAPTFDQAIRDLADRLGGNSAVRASRRSWLVLAAAAMLLTLLIGALAVGGLIPLPWVTDEPEVIPLGAFDQTEMEVLFDAQFEDTALVDGLLRYHAGVSGITVEFVVDAENLAIVRSSGRVISSGFLPPPTPDDPATRAWFDFIRSRDREASEWLYQQLVAFLSSPGSEVVAVKQFGRIRAEFRSLPNFMNGGSYDSATWEVQVAPRTQFSGFLPPVADDRVNIASVGRPLPLRWRLTDTDGSPILDLDSASVTIVERSCSSAGTAHRIEEYLTEADPGLQNLGDGFYQYNYVPAIGYAGSCKTLRLNLGEGFTSYPLYRTLDFQFVE